MKKMWLLLIIVLVAQLAIGNDIESFDEAKKISIDQKKPILLEFVRDDCLYCALAEAETDSVKEIREALEAVVHYSIDYHSDEGRKLAKEYFIGTDFPVFILVNSAGDVFNRYTGYTTSQRFLANLKASVSTTKTIIEKEMDFQSSPNAFMAVSLGKYFTDCQQYEKSSNYYQEANQLDDRTYYYQIFRNSALACENGQLDYKEVMKAADNVMTSKHPADIIHAARIITNLARSLGKTATTPPYLKRGLQFARQSTNGQLSRFASDFLADLALYEAHDIAKGLNIKKNTLGSGWQTNPEKFFEFAGWCLKRKINLEEALEYALKATNMAAPGPSRARVLDKTAAIYYELGNYTEAVNYGNRAIQDDPVNEFYPEHLLKYKSMLK